MRRLLRHPVTNAVCVSIFTGFYATIFFMTSYQGDFPALLYYDASPGAGFLWSWSKFLAEGRGRYLACALIVLTVAVVVLLLARRRPYDEYHTAILTQCLVVAIVLTFIAIAVFYVMILRDTRAVIEKFTLFVTIHWTTVVLADLVYVLISRWR